MGKLVDGTWHDVWYDTESSGGRFVRADSSFRGLVTADGSSGYAPEAGRYRLYVSYACPWAHRTLLVRALHGLEDAIPVTIVDPFMGENGWAFPEDDADPELGARFLHELYTHADPHYTGRVTVPVLWDRATRTIVSNESSEILRMLDGPFADSVSSRAPRISPPELRTEIDAINAFVYDRVNNGVYRAGFATSQAAYDEAVRALFAALDDLEERLARARYLVGDRLTEADLRLFTTLVRFDTVYHTHFKCTRRRLVDHPSLWGFTRDLFQRPFVRNTVFFDHIRTHYYRSHPTINPTRIVPVMPDLDWDAPHRRDRLGA